MQEQALACKLCGELFDEPLLLSCGHSLCKKCVVGMVSFNLLSSPSSSFDFKHPKAAVEEKVGDDKPQQVQVSCPTCAQKSSLPAINPASSLTINRDLRDAVEAEKKRRSQSPVCSLECGSSAHPSL